VKLTTELPLVQSWECLEIFLYNLQYVLVELNRFISLFCVNIIIMYDYVDCVVGYIFKGKSDMNKKF
jgi:hypothetical protein